MPSLTFLHPIALAGLTAAALPFLIHLLNRKKLARIPFSDMTFLKALQTEQMRRIRVRQILALILRTLAIFFLMLSLARPALRGRLSGVVGARAKTAMAVLVDVSYSMGYRTDRGAVLDRAKERVQEISSFVGEGDEVFLIPFARFPEVPDASIPDGTRLAEEAKKLTPSFQGTDICAAVEAGLGVLSRSENAHRELFLVTDETATGWEGFEKTREESESDEGKPGQDRVSCFLVSLGDWPRENTGVSDVELPEQGLGTGQPMPLKWRVRNYGDRDLKDVAALLHAGGRRVHQELFDIDSGATVALSAQVVPERVGPLSGTVSVDEDRLPADDRGYFCMPEAGALRVLLVKHRDEEVFFLRRALNPSDDESDGENGRQREKDLSGHPGGKRSGIALAEVQAERFSSDDLREQDLVILANVPRLSYAMARALGEYADRGGGIWIVLGQDVDTRFYNKTLLPELMALSLREPVGSLGDTRAVRSFGEMDFTHPVLRDLVDKDRMMTPHFYATYQVDAKESVRPVIRYRDGGIALAEGRRGRGKVMLLTTGATLEWGDFPRKGLFVPLVQRIARYLGTGQSGDRYLVGDSVTRNPSGTGGHRTLIAENPLGDRATLAPSQTPDGYAWRLDRVAVPGIWRLYAGEAEVDRFAVNVDPKESDLRTASKQALPNAFGGNPLRVIEASASLAATVQHARYGGELWRTCLYVTLALLLAEMLVARVGRKEGD
ncbi:MAG: BatA and WFA domain-containing protein [Candidatus Latescibacterota bacterium]